MTIIAHGSLNFRHATTLGGDICDPGCVLVCYGGGLFVPSYLHLYHNSRAHSIVKRLRLFVAARGLGPFLIVSVSVLFRRGIFMGW